MTIHKRIISTVTPVLTAAFVFLVQAMPARAAEEFTYDRLVGILNYLVTNALLLAGLFAVGVIVYAGARMATAGGNPAKFTEAKGMLIKAMIGAAIIFGVYTIIATVRGAAQSIGH